MAKKETALQCSEIYFLFVSQMESEGRLSLQSIRKSKYSKSEEINQSAMEKFILAILSRV